MNDSNAPMNRSNTTLQGVYLEFYVQESARHHGKLTHEWLLEQARALGIKGGSAFRALAGFGRHGRLHEEHFFELAGELPVQVGFALKAADAERLLECLASEQLTLFYLRWPVEIGVTGKVLSKPAPGPQGSSEGRSGAGDGNKAKNPIH